MHPRNSYLLGLVLLTLACGPGEPSGEDPPTPPEWAYGWWMDVGGPGEDPTWGAYVLQLEIRPDGTAFQISDYCNGPDSTYESTWEVQPDGAVRILPKPEDEWFWFLTPYSEVRYVDILPPGESCTAKVLRMGVNETQAEIERGRWCMGEYQPDINDCTLQPHCGEEPPTCE
ncbi:MAG: DUF4302 domain-containing protein [Deltaproteobacteria bacterium]|nr:DUF4302 domain-containing protein [Deltaproteobacteria bacterium]